MTGLLRMIGYRTLRPVTRGMGPLASTLVFSMLGAVISLLMRPGRR